MGVNTVQNALLDILQKNPPLHAEFSTVLTGSAMSTGARVDGIGTFFAEQIEVDDYVGNPSYGFRRVIQINSNVRLTVDRAYDADFGGQTLYKTQIKKGLATMEDITRVGQKMCVAFNTSDDIDLESARSAGVPCSEAHVLGEYLFTIGIIFVEPNFNVLDERKGNYDKWIRDAIDTNLTLNNTCVGISQLGQMQFMDHPEDDNIHLGAIKIICYPRLIRGNR